MSSEFTFRECFSEFMGTLGLCYFGGWALVLLANEKIDIIGVSLITSLAIAVFMYSGAAYSKCHFNPAITVAFLVTKHIGLIKSIFYMISQLVGAYSGGILLYYTLPDALYAVSKDRGAELGCPHVNNDFNVFSYLFAEFLGTFFLMFVFCILYDTGKSTRYALSVGLSVGVSIFMIGEITGAACNPFRYLGPALLTLELADFYVYLISPFLGAIAAAFMYYSVFKEVEVKQEDTMILQDLSRMDINN